MAFAVNFYFKFSIFHLGFTVDGKTQILPLNHHQVLAAKHAKSMTFRGDFEWCVHQGSYENFGLEISIFTYRMELT